jgi:hypothetical protein
MKKIILSLFLINTFANNVNAETIKFDKFFDSKESYVNLKATDNKMNVIILTGSVPVSVGRVNYSETEKKFVSGNILDAGFGASFVLGKASINYLTKEINLDTWATVGAAFSGGFKNNPTIPDAVSFNTGVNLFASLKNVGFSYYYDINNRVGTWGLSGSISSLTLNEDSFIKLASWK